MPTKVKPEIIHAAIAGFEEQKKRLDVQIAELRQLLTGQPADVAAVPEPTKRRPMSAAARARIAAAQRKRWSEARQTAPGKKPPAPVRKSEN
jgi:hypothetical protein